MQIEITDAEYTDMLGYLNDISTGEFACARNDKDEWRLCSYAPFTVEPERVIGTFPNRLDGHLVARLLNHVRTMVDRATAAQGEQPVRSDMREKD